jgi:hypothetical protein
MWGALSDEGTGLAFTISADLASAVILGSKSRGTGDHNLYFESSLFVASYVSKGYGTSGLALFSLRTDHIENTSFL